jgi:hypothetical protein
MNDKERNFHNPLFSVHPDIGLFFFNSRQTAFRAPTYESFQKEAPQRTVPVTTSLLAGTHPDLSGHGPPEWSLSDGVSVFW